MQVLLPIDDLTAELGLADEIWKPVRGYESMYEVSNIGSVRSLQSSASQHRGKRLVLQDREGYCAVPLTKKNKTRVFNVHRLVAECFIPNPNSLPHINHIDGNRSNNVLSNLEWTTPHGNTQNAIERGLMHARTNSNKAKKLSAQDVDYMKFLFKKKMGPTWLARRFNVCLSTVDRILANESWQYPPGWEKRTVAQVSK